MATKLYSTAARLPPSSLPANSQFFLLCGAPRKRKNWLFVHNDRFGRAYATLYSLITGAQRHGLDPQAYLRCVLAQIVTTPVSELGQFLPDVFKSRLAAEGGPGTGPGP